MGLKKLNILPIYIFPNISSGSKHSTKFILVEESFDFYKLPFFFKQKTLNKFPGSSNSPLKSTIAFNSVIEFSA